MRPSIARALAFACLTAVVATSPAAADTVTEQIELGLEYYMEGDYGTAITELEFAINDIRKLMSGRIGATFPDAPAGWSAMEASSAGAGDGGALLGALGGGSVLERSYTQDGGNGAMEATLMIDNPMIQGFAALLSNPALLATQPNTERLRIGREKGMLQWEPDQGHAEAMLLLDGRILVRVEGNNLSAPDPIVDLLNSWDLDALRAESAR